MPYPCRDRNDINPSRRTGSRPQYQPDCGGAPVNVIDGAAGACWVEKLGHPGWLTVYVPGTNGHGMRDGLNVLADFTYEAGKNRPCVVRTPSTTTRHASFQSGLAFISRAHNAPAIATFLTRQLAPTSFAELLRRGVGGTDNYGVDRLIRAVIAVAAECEAGTVRTDTEMLRDSILPAARQLLHQPVNV